MESRLVSLVEIVRSPEFQPRQDGIDDHHIAQLVETAGTWPPIVLVERRGALQLLDGFHRLAAAERLGLTAVPANILEVAADQDLRALAFELNARHGKPLGLADRRAEAERRLRMRPTTSNLEIARSVGLSPTTLASVRASLEANGSIPTVLRRESVDGRVYDVSEPEPRRALGELPAEDGASALADLMTGLIRPTEREHRKVARYLERVCSALEDQEHVKWPDAEHAASSVRHVLGDESAKELAEALGWYAGRVFDVACALGYSEDDE